MYAFILGGAGWMYECVHLSSGCMNVCIHPGGGRVDYERVHLSSGWVGGDRIDVWMCALLGEARGQRWRLSSIISSLLLWNSLLLNQELTHWPDCLRDEVQGSTCPPSPMLGLQPSTWLFCVAPEDQNSVLTLVQQGLHRHSPSSCLNVSGRLLYSSFILNSFIRCLKGQ